MFGEFFHWFPARQAEFIQPNYSSILLGRLMLGLFSGSWFGRVAEKAMLAFGLLFYL